MKLHKIKTILAVAAMGVLSQSCLDLDPKDQLAESNLWSSPSDFQLFANQFYSWTRDFGSLDNNSVIFLLRSLICIPLYILNVFQ